MLGNSLYKRHIKKSEDILSPEELFSYLCLTEMHPSFSNNEHEINRIINFKGFNNTIKNWKPDNFRIVFNNNFCDLFIKIGDGNVASFEFDFNLANNHPKSIFKDFPIKNVTFELENGCARLNHNIMVNLGNQDICNMNFYIKYINENPSSKTQNLSLILYNFSKISNVRLEGNKNNFLGIQLIDGNNIYGNQSMPGTECWLPSNLKFNIENFDSKIFENKNKNKEYLKIQNNEGQQGMISNTEVNYLLPPNKEGYGSVELPYYSKNFYEVYDFKSCYIPGGIRIKVYSKNVDYNYPSIGSALSNADIIKEIIKNNLLPDNHSDKKEIINILKHIPYYIPIDMTHDSLKKDDILIIKVKEELEIDYFKNVLGYKQSRYLFVVYPNN